MGKLWRRLYFLLHHRRLERELAEEMESHRQMMPAGRRSLFGNAVRLQEEAREAWALTWFEQSLQDLSYGVRVLCRAPGFTLGAAAVLALGVGVNLAELQIFDAMVFSRLHFRDARSVLQLSHVSDDGRRLGFASGAIEFFRAESRSFAWLAAEEYADLVVEGDADIRSDLVSTGYFANLGIVPAWGRLLDRRDTQPGAPPAAVLSYPYWQTRWGADPQIVGRAVHVNNQLVQIVGVAPFDFDGLSPRRTDVWLPVTLRPLVLAGSAPPQQDFSRASEALFGRLKAGVSQAAGEADLTVLARELARSRRAFADDERIRSEFVQASMSSRIARSPVFAIFVTIVLLVLFSACANLGNMLLARGLVREREIQIRLAIGASRTRLVRQLMTENILLAILGAAAGLAFGRIGARLLLNALGAPIQLTISLNGPIVGAAFGLTLLSAVLFGLPSALQTVRPNRRRTYLRLSQVGVQVAVSCLLLIASGVLAHNGIASASADLNFDYRNMVWIRPQLQARSLTTAAAQEAIEALSTRLKVLPGVDGVTAAVGLPLSGQAMIDSPPGLPRFFRNFVAPSYFNVMTLPVLRGRTFANGEQNAAIVSESAARAIWPGQDPLGKNLTLSGTPRDPGYAAAVIGVVRDSGANLLADADSVEVYLPLQGPQVARSALILHSRTDPAPLVRSIVAAAADVRETVSVGLMRVSREQFLDSQRRMITLIGSIGAVATALASAGMFALVAFAVAQRRRELGIRIAIGAAPRHILRVLLAQNAKPTCIGIAAGTLLALVVARLVRGRIVLPKQYSVDIIGFAAGIGAFIVVAALATLSPAMRALRIDPSATLREE
jgi:predicted permease